MNVLIVGYGVVGKHLHEEIKSLNPDIYDKKFEQDNRKDFYDIVFICVDTPYVDENNVCDITEVRNAINENKGYIYVIKSTILPGTTKQLREETNKRIIHSPEYYGNTPHSNNIDFNFTILGGVKEDCIYVQQALQEVYDASHSFRIVDSNTAELAKYMENCWLATKVSFCNQFYDIAEKCGVDYEDLRELFILDPRVNPSHTFVYRKHPYWDSHCLNKDVRALAYTFDAELIKDVLKFNNKK